MLRLDTTMRFHALRTDVTVRQFAVNPCKFDHPPEYDLANRPTPIGVRLPPHLFTAAAQINPNFLLFRWALRAMSRHPRALLA